jgi:hypothetical protein
MTTRRTMQAQIFQGTVVGIWTVVADAPKRNTRNVLEWTCECPQGHKAQIEHASLAYGITPVQCMACVEAERAQRAQQKTEENKLVRELAIEMLLKRQEPEAQDAQEGKENQCQAN